MPSSDARSSGEWPYLWLDATYLKVREGGRIISVAAIIAIAVNTDGRREIVGLHIGPSEAEIFWPDFLRTLFGAVLPASSRSSPMLTRASRSRSTASSRPWHRCRVHFLRNALSYVPKRQRLVVTAASASHTSPDQKTARRSLDRSPPAASLLPIARACIDAPAPILRTIRSGSIYIPTMSMQLRSVFANILSSREPLV